METVRRENQKGLQDKPEIVLCNRLFICDITMKKLENK